MGARAGHAALLQVPRAARIRTSSSPTASAATSRFNTNALGDFVIMRSNGLPVYNFCVAIDDAMMRITHVIRAVGSPRPWHALQGTYPGATTACSRCAQFADRFTCMLCRRSTCPTRCDRCGSPAACSA